MFGTWVASSPVWPSTCSSTSGAEMHRFVTHAPPSSVVRSDTDDQHHTTTMSSPSPLGPRTSSTPATVPSATTLHGRFTRLEPVDESHATSLFKHLGGAHNGPLWTYMLTSGWESLSAAQSAISEWTHHPSRITYAVIPPSDEATGLIALLAIEAAHKRLEIGGVIFGHALQRTPAATEAVYLVMRHVFALGYARVEWKANWLNGPSLRAARRLGFVEEGVFRKHMVVKGRERDTAWFSVTDEEWEATVRAALERWLSEENFDSDGRQRTRLEECRVG